MESGMEGAGVDQGRWRHLATHRHCLFGQNNIETITVRGYLARPVKPLTPCHSLTVIPTPPPATHRHWTPRRHLSYHSPHLPPSLLLTHTLITLTTHRFPRASSCWLPGYGYKCGDRGRARVQGNQYSHQHT